jgi:hypothetical protein
MRKKEGRRRMRLLCLGMRDMYPATILAYARANGRSFQSQGCLVACSECSCRKGLRDVTCIATTSAAASGIANFSPNLGIQAISHPSILLLGNR